MTTPDTSPESAEMATAPAPASAPQTASQPGAAPRFRHYFGVALLLILMGLPLLNMPFGTDQSLAALTSARMLEGTPPYAGTWFEEAPGILLPYTLAALPGLGRSGEFYLVALVLHLAAGLALLRFGWWLGGKALGVVSAVLWMVFVVGWGEAQTLVRAEDLTVAPTLWAVLLLCGAWLRSGRINWWRPMLAGALMGWVLVTRPELILVVALLPAVVAATCLERTRARRAWGLAEEAIPAEARNTADFPSSPRRMLTMAGVYAFAVAAVVGATFALLAMLGSLDAMSRQVVDWSQERAAAFAVSEVAAEGPSGMALMLETHLRRGLDSYVLFVWAEVLALLGLAAWAWTRRGARRVGGPDVAAAQNPFPWWAVGVVGAMWLLSFSPFLLRDLPWGQLSLAHLLNLVEPHLHLDMADRARRAMWWGPAPLLVLMAAFFIAAVFRAIAGPRRPEGAPPVGWPRRIVAVLLSVAFLVFLYDPGALIPGGADDGPAAFVADARTGVRVYKEKFSHAFEDRVEALSRFEYAGRFAEGRVYRPEEDEDIASKVRHSTSRRGNASVLVWGDRPATMFLGRSRGPRQGDEVRLTNVPLRAEWAPAKWWDQLRTEFFDAPPDWIVVAKIDAQPARTANGLTSEGAAPGWLRHVLEHSYQKEIEGRLSDLYIRRGRVEPPTE